MYFDFGRGFDLRNEPNFIILRFVFTKLGINGSHCIQTLDDENERFREETVSKAVRVKIVRAGNSQLFPGVGGEAGTKRFPRL